MKHPVVLTSPEEPDLSPYYRPVRNTCNQC